jgi:hypothetical protein
MDPGFRRKDEIQIVAQAQQPRDRFRDIRNPAFTWIGKAPSRAGPSTGNRAGEDE